MRYLALCTDYDGTAATAGELSAATIGALETVRASGRKVLLVTGRILDDLRRVCERLDLFDSVVAENGAVLYVPASGAQRTIGAPPPPAFIETLRARGVQPLALGRVMVALVRHEEAIARQTIRDLGLEFEVIVNKDAAMVLPAGLDKGSGLAAALAQLNLSRHNVIGIGDAENDHALLEACEIGVAVSDALPLLKQAADIVTAASGAAGVRELARELLRDDMRSRERGLLRHRVLLDRSRGGEDIHVRVHDLRALLLDASHAGRTQRVQGFMARLAEQHYNFCVLDAHGAYGRASAAIVVGAAHRVPQLAEALESLMRPDADVIINLAGMGGTARPGFLRALLGEVRTIRARTGRPHCLIIDTAEEFLPAASESCGAALAGLTGVFLISADPEKIAPCALAQLSALLVAGDEPAARRSALLQRLRAPVPDGVKPERAARKDVLYWQLADSQPLKD